MNYSGRNAVVLGLGLTGYSLARHLAARGANVRVADTRPAPPFAAKLAAALPDVPVATGPFTAATFDGADLVAISPGVAKDHPAIAAAVANGRRARRATSSSSRARCRPSRRCSRSPARTASRRSPRSPARCAAPQGSRRSSPATSATPRSTRLPAPTRTGRTSSCSSSRASSSKRRLARADAPPRCSTSPTTISTATPASTTTRRRRRESFGAAGIEVLNRDDPRSLAMRIPGRLVQTFGAGVPESEEAWGLVDRGEGWPDAADLARARRRAAPSDVGP